MKSFLLHAEDQEVFLFARTCSSICFFHINIFTGKW